MKNTNNSEAALFQPDRFKAADNSDAISNNSITGINRLVKLEVIVDGKIVSHFKHFKLNQSTRKHHEFQLTLAHDALEERENHQLKSAHQFLGGRLTVKMMYKDIDNSPERVFVGVITKVGFSQEQHSLGNIVLKGFSPTILLDSAPHTQSFGGGQPVHMGIIADDVIRQGIDKGKFDYRIAAKASSQILYSTQYDETHYNYLCRMAEAYNEQFFYDGEVLHFGNLPAQNKPLELIYGSNVSGINVELKAVHINPRFYGYNSNTHTKLISGQTPASHRGDLAQTAYRDNQGIFKTSSLRVAPIKARTDMDVENSQASTSGSQAVEVFSVSGGTTIPFLYPGCIADLKMRKEDSSETSYFTRIMITETVHEIDTLGHYTGSFEAIAADTGFLPKPEFTVPMAQPQTATVISNTDPDGQGRVQVRFDWQLHDTTNFIRVISPDAGGTDQVTQNRGYVAIPEVGDQVMVNFVHSHPDRPFVMGSLFHGGVALGGGIDNHLKSIQTRCGIRVLMNDAERSVTITDPSGNIFFMDGNGSITMTAPRNITMNAGENVSINAGQNVNITAGTHITTSAALNHTQTVGVNYTSSVTGNASYFITGKLTEMIDGDAVSEAKKDRKEYSAGEMKMQSDGNIKKYSQKTIYNNGSEKSNSH